MSFRLRPATPADADTLVRLILALADYERLRHEAHPDAAALRRHLAPDASPRVEAVLAEDAATGDAIGLALFFQNYSTFLTRWGIHLEDLFVVPERRGEGVGFALLKRVAEVAVARGAGRLEWAVLDWNTPAIGFYRRIGAQPMDDWTTMRVTGEALLALGTPA